MNITTEIRSILRLHKNPEDVIEIEGSDILVSCDIALADWILDESQLLLRWESKLILAH
jgi:hypothetical protein